MITADQIILASKDANCQMELEDFAGEVEQVYDSLAEDDKDAIRFAFFLATNRINAIVWH